MENFGPLVNSIISHIREGVLLASKGGEILFHNPAALEMLGIKHCKTLKEIKEKTGLNLQKSILRAAFDAGEEDAAARPSGEFVKFEERVALSGFTRFIEFQSGLVRVGQDEDLRILLLKDITEQRRFEAVFKEISDSGIITNDPKMLEINAKLSHISPTKASVLLQGESGTGKTLLARMIHNNSKRASHPFVEVNCAAIPETLLESELFGHVKGAFTGAVQSRAGRFQTAHKGTLFLDEISEIPIHLQPKLLKAIEEQSIQMVGSDKNVEVDVRVLSASNQELRSLVDSGKFRADLFYRLAVIPLKIPPLRERPGDLPLLITHFCDQLVARGYPDGITCTKEAMSLMLDYHWPGNVRELVNAVEHGMILAEDKVVTPSCLPQDIRRYSEPDKKLDEPVHAMSDTSQRQLIVNMLRQAGGSRSEAARMLGIDRSTLWRRMQRLGLQ